MAQITYDNKVALNSNPNIADINKVNDNDMNMIKNVVNANEAKILLAVASTAPAQCSEGDMYFNTSSKLIFTATGTDTWGNTGVAPTMNTLYIVLSSQTIYAYDGNTLVSVGGGSSSGGGESLPIGAIAAFAGSTAPDGYLICDGSAVSRTTYADLYTAIGTTYGSGDGSTTFNVPDIKGKVLVGLNSSDTDFDTLGETGGSKELQAHNHLIVDDSSKYVMYYKGDASGNINGQAGGNNLLGGSNAEYTGTTGTGNSGNLQPYIVINFIIKASKTTPIQAEVVNTSSNSQTDTYSCNYANTVFGGGAKSLFNSLLVVSGTTTITVEDNALYLIATHGNGNTSSVGIWSTVYGDHYTELAKAGEPSFSTSYNSGTHKLTITNTFRDVLGISITKL